MKLVLWILPCLSYSTMGLVYARQLYGGKRTVRLDTLYRELEHRYDDAKTRVEVARLSFNLDYRTRYMVVCLALGAVWPVDLLAFAVRKLVVKLLDEAPGTPICELKMREAQLQQRIESLKVRLLDDDVDDDD